MFLHVCFTCEPLQSCVELGSIDHICYCMQTKMLCLLMTFQRQTEFFTSHSCRQILTSQYFEVQNVCCILNLRFPVLFVWLMGKLHFHVHFNFVCLPNFWQKLEDEGKDNTTVHAHLEVLQLECRHRNPNLGVLAQKMSKTFRHHRDFIHHSLSVPCILEEYPALKTKSM